MNQIYTLWTICYLLSPLFSCKERLLPFSHLRYLGCWKVRKFKEAFSSTGTLSVWGSNCFWGLSANPGWPLSPVHCHLHTEMLPLQKQWLPLHFRQSRDFESGAVGSLQSCEINREWKKWALRSAPSPLPGRLGGDQKENWWGPWETWRCLASGSFFLSWKRTLIWRLRGSPSAVFPTDSTVSSKARSFWAPHFHLPFPRKRALPSKHNSWQLN